jgi:hypothetical protein
MRDQKFYSFIRQLEQHISSKATCHLTDDTLLETTQVVDKVAGPFIGPQGSKVAIAFLLLMPDATIKNFTGSSGSSSNGSRAKRLVISSTVFSSVNTQSRRQFAGPFCGPQGSKVAIASLLLLTPDAGSTQTHTFVRQLEQTTSRANWDRLHNFTDNALLKKSMHSHRQVAHPPPTEERSMW